MKNKKVCIIPARGGSKRIPRKNIFPICGKPLVNYSVEVALDSGIFDVVIVSTDDDEVEEAVKSFVRIHRRSKELSGDEARLPAVCENVLEELYENGEHFELFCLLQPTCPLRTVDDLQKSLNLLKAHVDFVVSVSEYDEPIFWAMKENKSGYLELHFGNEYLKPRQYLPKIYRHNGSIVWARTETFKIEKELLGARNTVAYKMPLARSLEIDYPHQLLIIMKIIEGKNNGKIQDSK